MPKPDLDDGEVRALARLCHEKASVYGSNARDYEQRKLHNAARVFYLRWTFWDALEKKLRAAQ